MASSALLLVLALALVCAPLTAVQATIKGSGFSCDVMCGDRKGMHLVVCKEGCEIQNHGNQVVYARFQCHDKCAAQKGIAPPAKKACEEQCEKEYKVKAAEVTAACNKTCDKEENKSGFQEVCRQSCTPPS